MTAMTDAIAAHRAAWRAFQDAPADDADPAVAAAAAEETMAQFDLLRTVPAEVDDIIALEVYLDWWVIEEKQRREGEPELFALQAAIKFAREVGSVLGPGAWPLSKVAAK